MQQAPDPHISTLLLHLKAGDETAFRLIFERYRSKVYYFLLHILENEADAEEGVQDVFMRVWTSRDRLEAVNNLDAYLFMIARNRALDLLKQKASDKKRKNEWGLLAETTGADTEELVNFNESARLIDQALAQLSPQQARIFRMSKEQGMKRQDIAAALNLSENTVKNHLSEAVKSIRDYLGKHGDMVIIAYLWLHL